MTRPDHITRSWFLTAGECDARGRMPLSLITERIIEIATEHANALGIGYADLVGQGIGWVLGRVSIVMERYPAINETYTMTTWIESYNRRFSDRCFEITDSEGNVIGGARTVWMVLDFATREGADLSKLDSECFPTLDKPCIVARPRRDQPLTADDTAGSYTFKVCDLDFNRHVNTVRYVELLLNTRTLDYIDHNDIARFDVAFHDECRYGQRVDVLSADNPAEAATADSGIHTVTRLALVREGETMVSARMAWRARTDLDNTITII